MEIGILAQYNFDNIPKWQKHPEIYHDFNAVQDIVNALVGSFHQVRTWGNFSEFYNDISNGRARIDLLLPLLENCFSRSNNGLIPAFLIMQGVPFIGNDIYVNTITSDKKLLKDLCTLWGIPTPIGFLIDHDNVGHLDVLFRMHHMDFPVVVKYRYGTMSYRTWRVGNMATLNILAKQMLEQNDGEILCETYIEGKELTVPIVGTGTNARVLSVIEYTDGEHRPLTLYDRRWKTELDEQVLLCRPSIPEPVMQKIIDYSMRLYCNIGFHDLGRMDFRLSQQGVPFLLEANSIPNLSINSAFDPQSYGCPHPFAEILNDIVSSAVARYDMKS